MHYWRGIQWLCALEVLPALLTCTLLALLVGSGAATGGGVYKWIDKDGKVHYGDRPPQNSKAGEIAIRNGAATPGATPGPALSAQDRQRKQQRLLDVFATERQERKAAANEKSKQSKALAARCAAARKNLGQAQDATYLYKESKSGERQIFSDQERAAAVRKLEQAIAKLCK